MKIYPTILSDSLAIVQQQLDLLQSVKAIETVQIDLIDGLFHPNLTISPQSLAELNFGRLKLDLHLMVDEPMETVLLLADFPHLPIRTVLSQIEHMSFQADYCEQVKKLGWQVGLSLDLYTPLSELDVKVLPQVEVIQLMGVEAGQQGQVFNEIVLAKLVELKQLLLKYQSKKTEIIVDGGVKLDNVKKIIQAGTDSLAMGSVLWEAAQNHQLEEKIQQLMNLD